MKIILVNTIFCVLGLSMATFASTTENPCASQSPTLVKQGCEIFAGQGTPAADQNLSNYTTISPGYTCIISNCVCTYYIDSNDLTIRQCDQGTVE